MQSSKLTTTTLTAILSLTSCAEKNTDFWQELQSQSTSLTRGGAILNFIEERITGFGGIRTSRDLFWRGGGLYETENGFYVGYFERLIYLIDKDGKVLSPGSETIRKSNGDILIEINKKEKPNQIPKNLLDIYEDYHRRILFEEKEGGVYIR